MYDPFHLIRVISVIRPSPICLIKKKMTEHFVGVGLSKKKKGSKSDWAVPEAPKSDGRDRISHLTPYENLIFVQNFWLNCAPFTTVGASLICAFPYFRNNPRENSKRNLLCESHCGETISKTVTLKVAGNLKLIKKNLQCFYCFNDEYYKRRIFLSW